MRKTKKAPERPIDVDALRLLELGNFTFVVSLSQGKYCRVRTFINKFAVISDEPYKIINHNRNMYIK